MNLESAKQLKRGDKLVYNQKKHQVWTVDHPMDVSKAKSWISQGKIAVPAVAGGGNCVLDKGCITVSTSTPNGRGSKRVSEMISDFSKWEKAEEDEEGSDGSPTSSGSGSPPEPPISGSSLPGAEGLGPEGLPTSGPTEPSQDSEGTEEEEI